MAPYATLDTLSFNPFSINENMNDNNLDPDLNFFHESVFSSLDTDYVSPEDYKSKFTDCTGNSFPVLHLNIRSLSKNFESLKELYNLLSLMFSIVRFSETWSKDEKVNESSLYQLEGYNLLHLNRKHNNGGGVAIYVKDLYSFEKRNDLSINSEAIESLSIEITNN